MAEYEKEILANFPLHRGSVFGRSGVFPVPTDFLPVGCSPS